jgi:hypothetical protein
MILVKCPYFEIELIQHTANVEIGGTGHMQTLIVTQGQGRFANGEFLMRGDAWVFPAAMPRVSLHLDAPLTGLLCSLPFTFSA